jgi:MSHA biogenesis protein MshQ
MNINGGTTTAITGNNNNVSVYSLSYSPVNMTFDSNGNAPFTFNYSDVGQVTLFANTTVPSAAFSATGASNAFITKPGGFELSSIMPTNNSNGRCAVNPNSNPVCASDATGAKFVMAGEAFSATVTATTIGGATAPNFGKENSPESIVLNSSVVSVTNNTSVGGNFGSFSNGVATGTNFTWDEVGIITLTPTLLSRNYMGLDTTSSGLGNVTGTTSGNIGRFYPAQFSVSGGIIANRSDVCPVTGCGSFTYMGEAMTAQFTLTAQAVDSGTNAVSTTQNYNYSATPANNFAKFDPTTTGNPLGLGAVDTAGPTPLIIDYTTNGTASGSFTSGSATITVPFAISRGASSVGPYNSVQIGIAPSDSDGVKMGAFNIDTSNSGAPNHTSIATTAELYGRMVVSGAYGSELLALSVPVAAQYWNGTNWALSSSDSNTNISAANITFSNWQTRSGVLNSSSTSLVSPVTLVSGIGNFTLKTPGYGNTGSANISVNIPAPAAIPYLPGNTAIISFGVFKGNSHFIYLREN